MSNSVVPNPESRKPPALRRAEQLSETLAGVARRMRISTRNRRSGGGSFRMRRRARLFHGIFIAGFVLLTAIPSLVGVVYYALLATPQYQAEAKFAVRTGEIPKVDGIGAMTGMPAAKIAQDTLVVTNYMQSRAIVEELERRLDLRAIYSGAELDWYARFNREKPIEKFVTYWKSMTDASIQPSSGIVTFTVRAFSAADAKRIAEAVIDLSEALVNDINSRMLRATVADAERELTRSAERLSKARAEFQRIRNTEGIIDAAQAGQSLADLLTTVQGERLRLQQEYDAQRKSVAPTAPQMRTLRARIDSLDAQIAELEARQTAQRSTTVTDRVLSESMTKFAQQDLERRIAERQYTAAASALQAARAASERQLVYLAAFVRPALPEDARYPRRWLYGTVIVLGGLLAWGLFCAAINAVRNHMA
ncbi:MAG TPA: lipopolysaccharide biosynthesis protein [Vineibacter sp.]|nr:lipopolysaccharide biosynthesis protein [Vineibacter sp.]